jgi:signal transduction histidine kinase
VIALEIDNLVGGDPHASLLPHALIVAVIGSAAFWRRRAPLTFVAVVLAGASVLVAAESSSTNSVGIAPMYVLIVLPYTAARECSRWRALVGLTLLLAWGFASTAATQPSAAHYIGTAALTSAAWGAGRWLRARRLLNDELARNVERISAERASRVRLAVADERTRIARELHALVAANVSAMVIQAEAAELLLDGDLDAADAAMAAVERTGRQAVSDMRRVLGVLRRSEEAPTLAPQPGVGQLYALVEAARSVGRSVDLSVEGEPGPLPASVDLGVYRIVEEALATVGSQRAQVWLRFGEDVVELEVFAAGVNGSSPWPTLAMRERVAICDGVIHDAGHEDGRRLIVSVPRALEEAFA